MNLGLIIGKVNIQRPIDRHSSSLGSVETGKGIFYTSKDLYGEDDYNYYVILIHLIDRALSTDNLYNLSTEQQKLLEQYFEEADKITPADNVNLDNHKYDFNLLTKYINILDEFLGSYFGDENGQYSKYGKKFFYSQRKPFSQKIESITRA